MLPLIVIVMDKIHESGSDEMGQMADGCDDPVMVLRVDQKGNRPEMTCDLHDAVHRFRGNFAGGRDDVVGIFQQVVRGILIAGFLRTGHGMASDKTGLHAEGADRFVDGRFGASHIGDDRAFLQEGADLLQVFRDIFDRSAEKDDIAFRKTFVDIVQDFIHNSVSAGLLQFASGTHVCEDPEGRIGALQAPGDGSADQSESDKSDGKCFHKDLLLFVRVPF